MLSLDTWKQDMEALLLVAIVFAGIAVSLAVAMVKGKGKGVSRGYPYQLSKYLLSKAERSFYGVLVQAVGNSGIVFSKVRIADVISPRRGLGRSDWQRAFNAISSKHFDFIVCEPADCSIKLAVELDDSSHGSSKARRRDDLVNNACESAGLPILRIKAAKSYATAELRRQVVEAILPATFVPEESAQSIALEQPASDLPLKGNLAFADSAESGSANGEEPGPAELPEFTSEANTCSKCGEPMVLRKANSGAHAGREFWGCSAFPKCRNVVPTV